MARVDDDPPVRERRWPIIGVAGSAVALALRSRAAGGLVGAAAPRRARDARVLRTAQSRSCVRSSSTAAARRCSSSSSTSPSPGPVGSSACACRRLVFFLLALTCMGPVAGSLTGPRGGWLATLLLALAPLAVGLATFARMYALLLWLVLAAAWLSVRAGRFRMRARLVHGGRTGRRARLRASPGSLRCTHCRRLHAGSPSRSSPSVRPSRRRASESSPGSPWRCPTSTPSRCCGRGTTSARRGRSERPRAGQCPRRHYTHSPPKDWSG